MGWLKKIFIDENKREASTHFPFFMICVSIIDVALLIYTIVYNKGIASMTDNPMAGASSVTLVRNGAKFVPCMKSTQVDFLQTLVACPSELALTNKTMCTYEEYLWYICNIEKLTGFPYQLYRFFASVFLHAGIIHLIITVVGQLILGIPLEQKFGSIRIAIIYIVSGIGGVLLSSVGLSRNPSVGASGAMYGILCVSLMDTILSWRDSPKPLFPIVLNVVSAIASLIIGIFIPIVDYLAHIGGLIVGIFIGLFICPNLYLNIRGNKDPVKSRLIIMGISFICLLVFFIGGFAGFFRDTAPMVYPIT